MAWADWFPLRGVRLGDLFNVVAKGCRGGHAAGRRMRLVEQAGLTEVAMTLRTVAD